MERTGNREVISVVRQPARRGRRRVLIMGAGGREFHNFNVYFRDNADYEVVAFTAAQIPGIAGRVYPRALAGDLYPDGIPIRDEVDLERLIRTHGVEEVVFAYSDVSHVYVMNRASAVLACGADFRLLGPEQTMLEASVPVVAVVAVRTGSGKSQTSRRVIEVLTAMGLRVAVVRHPMAYGDLATTAVQRFASLQDLDRWQVTVEEREEYEPHVRAGTVVFAGVDYQAILRAVEQEAQVVVWDGGNNDFSFFRPDINVVVADPLRPGHEIMYYPGETNLRMADVVVINKVDTATPGQVAAVRGSVKRLNPSAVIIEAASPITVEEPEAIRGKRVLVIEDGPTLTHGEMAYGAGVLAARHHGAAELIDPRPFAVESIRRTFERYPHVGPLLPAMGYGAEQLSDLSETIKRAKPDVILVATPVDLGPLMDVGVPLVRAHYELRELTRPNLEDVLRERVGGLVHPERGTASGLRP